MHEKKQDYGKEIAELLKLKTKWKKKFIVDDSYR